MIHREISITLSILILSGCVGLGVGTYGKKESATTKFSLAKERNQFSLKKRESPYTESDIIENWGEPDSIERVNACKVFIYKDGTSWAGAGAFIGVVPIPIAVPTGTYKNRFYLQHNTVIGLIQEYGEVDRTVGYTCGSNECAASAGDKVNEPQMDAEKAVTAWCAQSL